MLLGCGGQAGERVPREVEAQLPTELGALWSLCPAPDVGRRIYRREARNGRRQARALIRAVRERPDDRVTFVSHGSHNGKTYRMEMTVRELAEQHLDSPGAKGVPCERELMQELQDAVD